MRRVRRVLGLGVGACGKRVLLGVACNLGLGRHNGRSVCLPRGPWTLLLLLLLLLLRGTPSGLEAPGHRWRAVLAALWGALVDVDVGR